ncbi:DNA-directed RNA polymerase subunit E'' [Candidatus Woesearchaeota archaeon]|nr:DNA-directed RNA polymerase subunit E'' [Candidatus Woesearchaeota archaeon]
MSKKKICKSCKAFYDGPNCPVCKGNQTANTYQGRLYILDVEKSMVAYKAGYKAKGEFAIKVR